MGDGRQHHATHDLELVAAWAAGEATGTDLERAERQLDACDLCVGVARDLRAITLALQELISRGVLGPSFVVSAALSDVDIDRTVSALDETLGVYRRALEDGTERYLRGRPVKPVFRPYA